MLIQLEGRSDRSEEANDLASSLKPPFLSLF
jgi:hypothetical protein